MSAAKYNEIADDVKNVNLGAEFIFAYMADEEPILIRIYQNGRVSWEEGEFMAIGAGEPIAMAIHCQIDFYGYLDLTECLVWISQIKSAAEQNPYVGRSTTIVALLPNGKEEVPSDAMWRFIRTKLPRAVRFPSNSVKEIKKKKIPLFDREAEKIEESPNTSPAASEVS